MKQRLLQIGAAFLASVMMTFCNAPLFPAKEAPAEETEEVIGEIETFEFLEEDAPYEGTWISFEQGFKLYIPTEWDITEISEEQKENGLIFEAMPPAEDEKTPFIAVTMKKGDGETTLSGVGEKTQEDGFIYNGLVKMNDISCAAYTTEEEMEDDVVGIIFFDPSGEDYLISVDAHQFNELPSELMTVLMSLKKL